MAAERSVNTATVTTPSDREIRVERVFDAPRDLVFATMLDPELVGEWYGPHETKTTVEVMEPRSGGIWRYHSEDCDGGKTSFRGVYREVTAPERFVQTWEWEGMPGYVCLETQSLEDLGEQTKLVATTIFFTSEERDGLLSSGMERGMNESFERFDALLESRR
ncbi:MAG TPA: SRPBCC family protein [Solirubrobacterales bacterium]|nr:SRPBCC family protein [Solirubrobacterales bacterium]